MRNDLGCFFFLQFHHQENDCDYVPDSVGNSSDSSISETISIAKEGHVFCPPEHGLADNNVAASTTQQDR